MKPEILNIEMMLNYFNDPNSTEKEASEFIDGNILKSSWSLNFREDIRNIMHQSQKIKEQLVDALQYELDRVVNNQVNIISNHVIQDEGIYIN